MLDPTRGPASSTSGSSPRAIRCAAAASPTGPGVKSLGESGWATGPSASSSHAPDVLNSPGLTPTRRTERLVRADLVFGDAAPRLVVEFGEAGFLVVRILALIFTTEIAAGVDDPECRIGSLQGDVDRSVLAGRLAWRLVCERRKERCRRRWGWGRRGVQPGLHDEQESETEREGESMEQGLPIQLLSSVGLLLHGIPPDPGVRLSRHGASLLFYTNFQETGINFPTL